MKYPPLARIAQGDGNRRVDQPPGLHKTTISGPNVATELSSLSLTRLQNNRPTLGLALPVHHPQVGTSVVSCVTGPLLQGGMSTTTPANQGTRT